MTAKQYDHFVGRMEQELKVKESLIMMRLLAEGTPWLKARDMARVMAREQCK